MAKCDTCMATLTQDDEFWCRCQTCRSYEGPPKIASPVRQNRSIEAEAHRGGRSGSDEDAKYHGDYFENSR